MSDPEIPKLPPGFRFRELLSSADGEAIVLADAASGPVVVRVLRTSELATVVGELALSGQIDSNHLAAVRGGGTLPDGGAFVARDWIEGRSLEGAGSLQDAEVAALAHGIANGLADLHRAGFVHGDVKPDNVIRRPDGRAVLTDFGLARPLDGASTQPTFASGTAGFIAPETLLGGALTPRSDLFSLGVTILRLLGVRLPPPEELYGRFPAQPFLDVVGATIHDDHPSLGPLVASLLESDPSRRPPSADDVVQTLAGHFGLQGPPPAPPACPQWSHWRGREALLERAVDPARLEHQDWRASGAEEARALAEEGALSLSLQGLRCQHVDLDRAMEAIEESVALDRWLAHLERRPQEELLILSGDGGAWGQTLRAAIQGMRRMRPVIWIHGDLRRGGVVIPVLGPGAIEAEVARALPGETAASRTALVAALVSRTREGSVATYRRFAALFDGRRVIRGPEGPRLAPDIAPETALPGVDRRRSEALGQLSDESARWLAQASACHGSWGPSFDAVVAGCSTSVRLELMDQGLATIVSTAAGPRVRPSVHPGALELGIPRPKRLDLYATIHSMLERDGAPVEATWPWALLAGGDGAVDGVLAQVSDLIKCGVTERASSGLARTVQVLTREAQPMPGALVIEHGRALALAGDLDGAAALLPDGPRGDARDALHVKAICARARGESPLAVQLFLAAGLPAAAEEEQIHVAFQGNALAEVEERAQGLLGSGGELPDEQLINVASIAMVAAARRGDGVGRDAWMGILGAAVKTTESPVIRAKAELNRGTVLRDGGELEGAAACFEASVASFAEAGLAAPLAQARIALSGVLRDLWHLTRAEALAEQALGSRRRLGDRIGADVGLGMRGLARLDRGHLASALPDLEAAAAALRTAGQVRNAAYLQERAFEAAARLGVAAKLEPEPREGADPRELIAHWRAVTCSGASHTVGPALLHGAVRAARASGLGTALREAEWLLDRVHGSRDLDPGSLREQVEATIDGEGAAGDPAALLERTRELGADAHAARLALAMVSREEDDTAAQRPRAILQEALQAMFGTESPPSHPSHHLLGRPDPAPAHLESLDEPKDDDMDVKTILAINKRLVEQEDLDTLLGAIVDAALEVTGGERGFLMLEERGELVLDRAIDSSRGDLDAEEVEYSSSIVLEALREGSCLRIADAKDDVLFSDARSVSRLELRSVLAQPFEVEPGLNGVIVVDDRRRVGQFGDREASLIGLLAEQAALAVRQVRRLDKIRSLRDELAERVVDREERLEVLERRLEETGEAPRVEGLVGDSEVMGKVHLLLRRVAGSDIPVLVTGESGTGKELAARAVHSLSSRSDGPFITANCAAFPDSLIESELFGARKGAYTGSNEDRAGLFERADAGTLFLDEIGELPLAQQAKLLRVLETRQVRRVGDDRERDVDFRLVVATNRDLAAAVEAGTFREDLVYRLNAVSVRMPPLGERQGDIPLLVQHFLRIAEARDGRTRTVSPEVLRVLMERPWPGNVRELANEVARLVLLSDGQIDDPGLVREPGAAPSSLPGGFVRPMRDIERDAILATLASVGGDKRRAAEVLGISRAKIYQRLKEWGDPGS